MITISVVDNSAESRLSIISFLDSALNSSNYQSHLLPRINFKSLSLQELKFNSACDLLILGPQIINHDFSSVAVIKQSSSAKGLIAWIGADQKDLRLVDQLCRSGFDDIFSEDLSTDALVRRVMLLVKNSATKVSEKVILLDGGKGGVGVSSVAAGLAELLSESDKKIVCIDLNFESQDLSRFLQVKPYLNDALKQLLLGEKAINQESVLHCCSKVWQEDELLYCMPPAVSAEELIEGDIDTLKRFIHVIEVLDSAFDYILIDSGAARGALQKLLYQLTDRLIFVINDDPACLFAAADKLNKFKSFMPSHARLFVVENQVGPSGLGKALLRKEFCKVANIKEAAFSPFAIPACINAKRWPASGATLYSLGKKGVAKGIVGLAQHCELLPAGAESNSLRSFVERLFRKTQDSKAGSVAQVYKLPDYSAKNINSNNSEDDNAEKKIVGASAA